MRYHKNVFFPVYAQDKLTGLCYKLNFLQWQYTPHCIDNLKTRVIDLEQLLYFIKTDLKLNSDDVFEFYTDAKGNIEKLCLRVLYNKNIDIILVISNTKNIITIYINSSCDNHNSLRKNLYCKA